MYNTGLQSSSARSAHALTMTVVTTPSRLSDIVLPTSPHQPLLLYFRIHPDDGVLQRPGREHCMLPWLLSEHGPGWQKATSGWKFGFGCTLGSPLEQY